MRMPSHTALCSFVFSMILTSALIPSTGDVTLASAGAPAAQMAVQSALNGLRAQGFAASAGIELPAPVPSPAAVPADSAAEAGSPLSPEVLSKILQLIASKGVDRDLPSQFASPLGLSATGQAWAGRSAAWIVSPTVYGVYVSRGSDQDLLFTIGRPKVSMHAFRARRDGQVVSAYIYDVATQKMTMRMPAEAQAELDAEIGIWTDVVNQANLASK